MSLVLIIKEGGETNKTKHTLFSVCCRYELVIVYVPFFLRHIQGKTNTAEYPGATCPTVHLIWSPIPCSVTLPADQSQGRWGYLLVVANTLECAETNYDEGLSLMSTGNLRPSQEKAWKELWLNSRVEVTGSETLSKALIGCMFYLLSAFPSIHDTSSDFGGVSPGGLSNGGDGQDYWGHVFWDQVSRLAVDAWLSDLYYCMLTHVTSSNVLQQDIWMYPSIALFYPKLARAVLEYRVRTIDGAKDNAEKQGFKV